MLLSPDEWPAQVAKSPPTYYWLDDWNRVSSDNFAPKLAAMLDVSPGTIVQVFWMEEPAVECPSILFIKYWKYFLFEDEDLILLQEYNNTILLFNAAGYVWVAQRP